MASTGKRSQIQKYMYQCKKVFFSLILLCVLCLFVAQYYQLKSPSMFRTSRVKTLTNMRLHNGEVFIITKKNGSQTLIKNNTEFYIVVEPSQATELNNYEGIEHLVQIIESSREYDGAACNAWTTSNSDQYHQNLESCWFKKRNWSMMIYDIKSPKKPHSLDEENAPWLSSCNIVESPFVIRRSVFSGIGLKQSYGEATLLDFFLRSNGTLKIAVSQKCAFSKNLTKMGKGSTGNKHQVHLDYALLGHNHNILRIIRPNSITWTKCSYQHTSCPDIPEQQTRADNILLPYCCKTLVNDILIATVKALNQIGIEYRVCFSTLLGAIRSKTAIPWDGDVDFCINSKDSNTQTFEKLEEALRPTNYTHAPIFGVHRVIPLNALVKRVSNHSLVSESDLFSKQVLQYMQEMLPVPAPLWKLIPYADFYAYDKIYKRGKINVTIDGLEYPTGDKPHELLREWYGSKYMSTEKKDRVNSAAVG